MPDLQLELILRAQDRMSAELRAVQTEMQSFQAQVAAISGTAAQIPTSNVITQLGADAQRTQVQVDTFSASLGRIKDYALGAITAQVLMPAVNAIEQIPAALIDTNSQLEQATTSFRVFTGSAETANEIVKQIRANADLTPFITSQIMTLAQGMMPFAGGDTARLMSLVRTGETLAALRPSEGVLGASMAMQEAQGGIFTSAERRFGIPREFINQAKENASGVDVLTAALTRMGVGWSLVTEQAKTWTGVTSTIQSQMEHFTQEVGAGAFTVLKDQLVDLNAAMLANKDATTGVAEAIGTVVGTTAQAGVSTLTILVRALATEWDAVALAARIAGEVAGKYGPPGTQSTLGQAGAAVGRVTNEAGVAIAHATWDPILQAMQRELDHLVSERTGVPTYVAGEPVPHDLGGGPLAFPSAPAGAGAFGQAYIARRQQEEAANVDIYSRMILPGEHAAPAGARSISSIEGGIPAAQAFLNLKSAADEASAALKSIGEQHTRAQGFLGDAQAAIAIYKQAGQAIPPELLKFQQTMMLDTRTLTIQKAFADVGAWQASGGQTAFLAQTVAINAQIVNVQGLNAQGQNDTGAGFVSSGSGPDRGDRPGANAVAAAAAAPTANVIHVHPVASPSHAKYIASRSQGAGGQPHR